MDEHGPDAPDSAQQISDIAYQKLAQRGFSENALAQRKYLPTLADLIDRLTIVILKQINISHVLYDQERADIEHDIDLLLAPKGVRFTSALDAKMVSAVAMIMLANKTIWDNESETRKGLVQIVVEPQRQLNAENIFKGGYERLRFTHSINGVRNRAKNVIAKAAGERVDAKVDCLAADLPKEFGAWENII